jgi:polar amino acid transport system permease protein
MDGEYILQILPSIFSGFIFILTFWIIVLVVSTLLALFFAAVDSFKNKIISKLIFVYTSLIRGTPLLFQMYFVYFGFPLIFNIRTDAIFSAYFTFIISWTAYLIEAFRGAINGIEQGQLDAAKTLGLSKWQTMYYIVLPQAITTAIPSITNQAVSLVYGTAMLSILGLDDMLKAARIAVIRDFRLEGFAIAGVFYILLNGIVILFFKKLEAFVNKYKKS